MFKKLVAIEPVNLIPSAEEALHRYAREVVLFGDVPKDDAEIIRRIGDADAVLLSYTSRIGQAVIDACPAIHYIGMCCSLYSEASANVDIAYARQKNIRVLGIRDYGDRGVVEYVLHELIALLHGYGMPSLRDEPIEITRPARGRGRPRRFRPDDCGRALLHGRGDFVLQPLPQAGGRAGGHDLQTA